MHRADSKAARVSGQLPGVCFVRGVRFAARLPTPFLTILFRLGFFGNAAIDRVVSIPHLALFTSTSLSLRSRAGCRAPTGVGAAGPHVWEDQ